MRCWYNSAQVTATDSGSASVTDTFNLTVTNTNDAPTISSTAVTSAIEDCAYSYTIAAGDVDSGDTVIMQLQLFHPG